MAASQNLMKTSTSKKKIDYAKIALVCMYVYGRCIS